MTADLASSALQRPLLAYVACDLQEPHVPLRREISPNPTEGESAVNTDLNEIKCYLRAGYILRNRGMGWALELPRGAKPPSWQMAESLKVHPDIVALLSAQGSIKTELRVAGSATWVPEPIRVGVAL